MAAATTVAHAHVSLSTHLRTHEAKHAFPLRNIAHAGPYFQHQERMVLSTMLHLPQAVALAIACGNQQERWAELKSWLDSTRTKLKENQGSFSLFDPCLWPMGCSGRNDSRAAVTVAVTVTDSWFLIHDDLMTHDS